MSLGQIQSRLAVAHADFLCRFDAHDAHDTDGYSTSSAWLAAKAKLSKRDAKSAVRRASRQTFSQLELARACASTRSGGIAVARV